MAISILAARYLSLASISSKVLDDSLSRLIARIGYRVSLALPTSTIGRLVELVSQEILSPGNSVARDRIS